MPIWAKVLTVVTVGWWMMIAWARGSVKDEEASVREDD